MVFRNRTAALLQTRIAIRSPAALGAYRLSGFSTRGPGKVTFDPAASPVVYGEPLTLASKVSFTAAGTYVLRATANDGQLFTPRDLTVTVR
jgi:hypothetical protein